MRLFHAAIALALPLLACCPGSKGAPKPDNFPSGDAFVTKLLERQNKAVSFRSLDNRMDYRVGDERIKTTVLVMGERGAKIRFNAENPSGDVGADLACDGIGFQFVDFNKNCQLSGPCTSEAIAQLLRIDLEPDDFMALAIGAVPILLNASASSEWHSKNGTAVIKLLANDNTGSQEIILDGEGAHYDVVGASARDAKGEIEWKLANKDFSETKDEAGTVFRVPGRTHFEQPKSKGDLKIRWSERELNIQIPPDKYIASVPDGLPECGRAK